jgi:hypothetical protein
MKKDIPFEGFVPSGVRRVISPRNSLSPTVGISATALTYVVIS